MTPSARTPDKVFGQATAFHCYLPIPDEVFHGGIYVTSVGHGTTEPQESYPPKKHPALYHFNWAQGRVLPEFSLMLLTAGSGVFESRETGQTNVQAGTAILLFPDVWHRYAPAPETGWTEKWVHFNGELAHRLLEQGVISPDKPVIPLSDSVPAERAFDHLIDHVRGAPTSNSLLVSLMALGALTAVIGPADQPPPAIKTPATESNTDPMIAAARDIIWTRSHKVLSVADVVAVLGVERRTLERRFAAKLGHTVLDEIIQCRFRRAERLLSETDLPIKTIVTLAGFGSIENMRQVFMAETGLSAAGYRRRQQQHRKRAG
ncbi:MAG: helix-turn-helix domain-containing protein [Opitutaceae bacterium]|jgi:AraC-like DNA-binding protein